ncbi:formate dehydrogenase accessory protein FdhE [Magnetospirillum moscoviense]|uniref:Protein FdhE homolog n=1 Tax=Magnetospirillum moscoviense TaxID=1437059 RepID=A0A178MP09_9PROT|nr:formate dehydrogenase accessory protein FdhE [Magnetospirillum moscoviense]MBF0326326.1 formate dehydrogenase accessory protein FdhE [Alphaproteobacteria bacterium]OAN50542.1 hypothetical protein A6A05_12275 [Magnetospirillum moscoviense]
MSDSPETLQTGGGTTVPPPVVLLPDPALMFDRRSRRLAAWADDHPMGEYLAFLSHLAAAQHRAVKALGDVPCPAEAIIARRRAAGMPLLPREASYLTNDWRLALAAILDAFAAQPLPDAARSVIEQLAAMPAPEQDALAAACLTGQAAPDDLARGLFVLAALQVFWAKALPGLDPATIQPLDPPGLCPVCGSAPVAGLTMAAEPLEGVRYLACGLCGCHWHYPRAQCSSCGSDKDIAYLAFEGPAGHVRGETCSDCRTYLKLFDEAKSPGAEPFADDLATVGLDLRLAEENWHRAVANPFLQAGGG